MKRAKFRDDVSGVIKALGLVFGDIGTSPIYTLTVIALFVPKTPESMASSSKPRRVISRLAFHAANSKLCKWAKLPCQRANGVDQYCP